MPTGEQGAGAGFDPHLFGAALTVGIALVTQMGEQVDYLRFMPEKTPANARRWWFGVIVGGPGWVLPGLVDAHSHAFQRGMAGLAEVRGPGTDSFWSWRELMYRFLGRISPDDAEAIAEALGLVVLLPRLGAIGEAHGGVDARTAVEPGVVEGVELAECSG